MLNYESKVRASVPEGADKKGAYLIGGGIASLAAAAFMIRDGGMNGKNIHVLEKWNLPGGSLDGAGNAEDGYVCRGGREMEDAFECTWDLLSTIKSLENPDMSVLEEFRMLNMKDPSDSACRVVEKCGQNAHMETLGLSKKNIKEIGKLVLAKEEDLGDMTIEQYFSASMLKTNFWLFWATMFAFEPWHRVGEMKRYFERFMHLFGGINKLKKIRFSKYNQYESLVLPIMAYLTEHGVDFQYGIEVTDFDFTGENGKKYASRIHAVRDGKDVSIDVTSDDMVLFTNGSMTQNSTLGSMKEAPVMDTAIKGCFAVWRKLAAKDTVFGNPEPFISYPEKSNWESFTITCYDDRIPDLVKKITGRDPHSGKIITGGPLTMKDSSWLLTLTISRQPHFRNQPKNVIVIWAYGLFSNVKGDFIKKTMRECSGEELVSELLYHLGAAPSSISDMAKSCKVIPVMMPFITSMFMPFKKGDRPDVLPKGYTNFALLGQFADLPFDTVFTVEYSIRTAMVAVYSLLKLDRQVPEVYPTRYDTRVLADSVNIAFEGRRIPFGWLIKKLLKKTQYEGWIK